MRAMSSRIAPGVFLLASICAGCGAPVMAPVLSRDREPAPVPAAAGSERSPIQPDAASYTVQKGDTVYSIAWRAGEDFRNVARWNAIQPPYLIVPGEVLRLHAPAAAGAPAIAVESAPATRAPGGAAASAPAGMHPLDLPPSGISWRWPTHGTLLRSTSPTAKNGIDISGRRGQAIITAAPGDVVYSGSGLLGYGRLIIVKHSDTFLSAYAHNDTLLVKEGEHVSSGQKIATMGIGNSGMPILHFEIRKDGKPVNPLDHLPGASS